MKTKYINYICNNLHDIFIFDSDQINNVIIEVCYKFILTYKLKNVKQK